MFFGKLAFMKLLRECQITLLSFLREAFVCNITKTTHNKEKIQESEHSKVRRVSGDARKSCFRNQNNIIHYEYTKFGLVGRPKQKIRPLCVIR